MIEVKSEHLGFGSGNLEIYYNDQWGDNFLQTKNIWHATLFYVNATIYYLMLRITNIGYCVLKIDMGRETLHWPKWSWYVQILVGHIDELRWCSNHVFVDVNLGMLD